MLRGRLRTSYGTRGLRGSVFVCLGAAAVSLSIVSLGLPGTVVLVGGWLLAYGLGRRVPGLAGPVSWAAALVLEVAVLTADTMALERLSPHEHGVLPNLAALAGPAVIGLVLAVPWPRRPRRTTDAADASEPAPVDTVPVEPVEPVEPVAPVAPAVGTPSRPLVALTIMAAGLVVPLWIASHGVNYRVAWTMSGDARNHVLLTRSLLENGGLSLRVLKIYPAVIDAVTAMIAGAGGRSGLLPGQLMLHDAHAQLTTYVLAGIALSLMTAAALLELVPSAVAVARRLPAATTVLVLGSAAIQRLGKVMSCMDV